MKVLHISFADGYSSSSGGGGAIAVWRLHQSLRKAGIDSKILCAEKSSESAHVIQSKTPKIESILESEIRKIGLTNLVNIGSRRIIENKAYKEADILCINSFYGVFNHGSLPSLTKQKPGILTLHDMWNFTGHCYYSYDCERWKSGCGKCPHPYIFPEVRIDNTHLDWKLKEWNYSRSNLTVVAPSKWLTEQVKQSMLKRFPIRQIPYGIDTETYQPLDTEKCRSILGIPLGKKVLMFAAFLLNDYRKGGDLLVKALQSLPESLKAETVLLMFGKGGGEKISELVGMQSLHLGYISGDRLKVIAYSAADLFIFPTRADNLPLVLQESMACGTPIVSFNVGGVSDLVRPGITGYLAEPENTKDICNGIVQLLEDEPARNYMGQQCRAIALEEYSSDLYAQRYVELYHHCLETSAA